MRWREVNFDGLVGPSHHYGGLAFGNRASVQHEGHVSYPRQAALQGLAKMRLLMERGLTQGVLPPQVRPNVAALRQLGFGGSPDDVVSQAWAFDPALLALCSSASSMWVANAATVVPSCDTPDHRTVLMPANLISHGHRHLEVQATQALLEYVFADSERFRVTQALPSLSAFADEGAANHMRIGLAGEKGDEDGKGNALHVLVYGSGGNAQPTRFPARQTRAACEALVRQAGLAPHQTLLVQQHPDAIDAGVFHNDVIAVSHDGLLLCHERAFYQQEEVLGALRARCGDALTIVEVRDAEVSLEMAVQSYLFNSQILGEPDRRWMVLPQECHQHEPVRRYVENTLVPALSLTVVQYLDLKQSMRNGGGPACLRLRAVLNDDEIAALQGRVILNEERWQALVQLVETRYPETMSLAQLAEPGMAKRLGSIIAEIYEVLALPPRLFEPFQQ